MFIQVIMTEKRVSAGSHSHAGWMIYARALGMHGAGWIKRCQGGGGASALWINECRRSGTR